MDSPQAIIVAGPNGCGKTTFVGEFLKSYTYPYISADLIAERLPGDTIEDVRLEAGRAFFAEIRERMASRESFVAESTLSGLTFQKLIGELRVAGYEISIVFIFLGSANACVDRIEERIRRGGHPVPEADVRRRFSRSTKNFWDTYRALADRWHLFYNGGVQFHEVALGERGSLEVRDETLFQQFREIVGEVAP